MTRQVKSIPEQGQPQIPCKPFQKSHLLNKLPFILLLLFWKLPSIAQPGVFVLGTHVFSDTCTGTLYDSGGAAGSYGNNEMLTFTLCPQASTQCLLIDVQSYDLENNFDFLYLIAGTGTGGPRVATLNGGGGNLQWEVHGACLTVFFKSDNSGTGAGFKLTWQCSPDSCNVPLPSTCSVPAPIPTLPWSQANLSTCYAWDEVQPGTCPGDGFLAAEDFILTYESPGNECIAIRLSGSEEGTGIAVYDACPENSPACLALSGGSAAQPHIDAVFLENPGTYYLVVDNLNGCTAFNIEVERVACPVVFPSPALCANALSFNGCSPGELPAVVTVAPGQGQAGFLQPGVNLGCWENMFPLNFAWFFFEAKTDGEFAFLLDAAHPGEVSDVDFQVWGPIADPAAACQFAASNQPIRSSYADGADPTGLAHVHPINGSPVTDGCEGAMGDDFVKPIPVKTGEFYLVLVNDWEGNIVSGAVAINFAGTSPGVLDGQPGFAVSGDTTVCPGAAAPLLATGGEAYQWMPAQGLSCSFCPNPLATVPEAKTYRVAIHMICRSDTLDVTLDVFQTSAGDDRSTCLGEQIQLGAMSNLPGTVSYQWQTPNGTLSCAACDSTFFVSQVPGSQEVTLLAGDGTCTVSDTLLVTVLDSPLPAYEMAENQTICSGDTVYIGGVATPGVSYSWHATPPSAVPNVANPGVSPSATTVYFLEVKQDGCPVALSDSVVIEVVEPPVPVLADTLICPGGSALLDPAVGTGFDFAWTSTDPAFSANSPLLEVLPANTTVFFLKIENGICLPVMDTATVFVAGMGVLEVNGDTVVCGFSPLDFFTDAGVPGTYFWKSPSGDVWSNSDPALPFSFIPGLGVQALTVAFIDAAGCATLFDTLFIRVEKPVEIDSIGSNRTDTVYVGTAIELSAFLMETPAMSYQWSSGDTGSPVTVFAKKPPTESWSVTVTDALGCTDSAGVTFIVLEPLFDVPNAFSPNGDGVNDRFRVVYCLEDGFEVLSMKVFNRWGKMVYEEQNGNAGWDGNYRSEPAPAEVYVYYILLKMPDGALREIKGDITLLR
jgi:gliding motility-associated-like protein